MTDAQERRELQALAYGPGVDPAVARAAAERLAGSALPPSPAPSPSLAVPDHAVPAPDRAAPETAAIDGSHTGPPGWVPAASAAAPEVTRRPRLRHRWLGRRVLAVLAATAALGIAVGVGSTLLLTHLPASSPTTTSPTGGTESDISGLLARPQAAADRLPSGMASGVEHATSRLLFMNVTDHPRTPWTVWVAIGRSNGDICFVVSPDRTASTVSCVTRDEIAGSTGSSFVASDGGDGVRVVVHSGVVDVSLLGAGCPSARFCS